MSQAAYSVLDTALNETIHAVRPVPVLPLLLSLGVDLSDIPDADIERMKEIRDAARTRIEV